MKLYPDDWRVRVSGAVGGGAGMAAALLLRPSLGVEGLLPGGLAVAVGITVGVVLGLLVGRLLFLPSSAVAPDRQPHA